MKLVYSIKYLELRIFRFLKVAILLFFFLVLSSCNSSEVPETVPSPEPQPILSFAVISDPESDLENLKKAFEKTKEKGLEFVIIPGDLTQTGIPEEFDQIKQAVEQSDLEYYFIQGNHDFWYSRKNNLYTFNQFFGPSYYTKQIGDYQFIFLDNSDEYLGMGSAQLSWFDQTYNLQPTTYNLIFSHIPLYHSKSPKAMGELNPKLKKEALDLLVKLCQNPPLAIFSGHLHQTEDYEYQCPDDGPKIRMINAGSVNEKRNLQLPRFLKVDIFKDNKIKIEEIEL